MRLGQADTRQDYGEYGRWYSLTPMHVKALNLEILFLVAALATFKPIVAGVLKYNSSTNLYLKSKYLIPMALQFRAVVESI
ncbi:hypothetical protein EYR41_004560 [Orbilia oligospora]|uniref:Uncharacterized protein n=1 Tax=Orbilia oligospora TaxID=2813651 RepID=A0A8H2EB93_ORBOL|nr:hypothetical protein EYR41_004560 [Orbilia oligospora]